MAPLSTRLSVTVQQRLAITPAMRQALATLQMSSPDLLAEVREELGQNPLLNLEEGGCDPFASAADWSTAPAEEEAAETRDERLSWLSLRDTGRRPEMGPDAAAAPEPAGRPETLSEHLLGQLHCLRLSADELRRAEWLIGNLDERGWLAEPLTELRQAEPDASDSAWLTALRLVQSLDPAGVGAADAAECLLLQLRRERFERRQPLPAAEAKAEDLALRLLTDAERYLSRLSVARAAKELAVSPALFRAALARVARLDPDPAACFAELVPAGHVLPEVLVERGEDGWQARLNPAAVPRLSFNHAYYDILLASRLSGDELAAWRERARRAQDLTRAVEHRFATIVAVAQTIVSEQSEFFAVGASALRPLTLRDVARRLGLSESTVSRAVNGKYLQSRRGVIELRRFFSAALPGAEGELVSAAAVRSRLLALIAGEDPLQPLSDEALSRELARAGLRVARRTVTKYRELEGIAPGRLRRRSADLASA